MEVITSKFTFNKLTRDYYDLKIAGVIFFPLTKYVKTQKYEILIFSKEQFEYFNHQNKV